MTDTLAVTAKWFREAYPITNNKTVQVQMGVHFEEVSEMLAEIKGKDRLTQAMLTQAMVACHALALHLKSSKDIVAHVPDENRLGYLDALCDQHVTLVGCGHHSKLRDVAALVEVNESNNSKFVNGKAIFDSNGKIAKGPNYRPPNLEPFV